MATPTSSVDTGTTNPVRDKERAPSPATETSLGFVGLGHMGGNMASRLLAAGYAV
jgi:phosphoglycerate dehydrogenase-like enzyme